MPYKYAEKKGWHVPKQKHKVSNWSEYNQSLCHRGNIDIWLSDEAIEQWCEKNQGNDGSGKSKSRQKNEAMIGCGVLNKMTGLGMPQSYRRP